MRSLENGRGHISQLFIFVLQKVYVAISTLFLLHLQQSLRPFTAAAATHFPDQDLKFANFGQKLIIFFKCSAKKLKVLPGQRNKLVKFSFGHNGTHTAFPPRFILDGCCCILPLSLFYVSCWETQCWLSRKNEKKCFFSLPPSHLVFPSSLQDLIQRRSSSSFLHGMPPLNYVAEASWSRKKI